MFLYFKVSKWSQNWNSSTKNINELNGLQNVTIQLKNKSVKNHMFYSRSNCLEWWFVQNPRQLHVLNRNHSHCSPSNYWPKLFIRYLSVRNQFIIITYVTNKHIGFLKVYEYQKHTIGQQLVFNLYSKKSNWDHTYTSLKTALLDINERTNIQTEGRTYKQTNELTKMRGRAGLLIPSRELWPFD